MYQVDFIVFYLFKIFITVDLQSCVSLNTDFKCTDFKMYTF